MSSEPTATENLADKKLGDLTDAEIAQLTASIKDEQAKERPLLGTVEPLERLLEEYQEGTGYRTKVKRLIEDGWTGIRRSRGDGDCFYRGESFSGDETRGRPADLVVSPAFIFSLLSSYLARPAGYSAQLLSTFESLLPLLSACGFEEMVWFDFWEPLRDILRRMGPEEKDGGARRDGEKRLGPGELFDLFNDQETNRCVSFLALPHRGSLPSHAARR